MSPPLLTVRRLTVRYELPNWVPWQQKQVLRAVDGIDFNLAEGETLGIVGESGCGKSTLARALAGLQTVSSGAIHYRGQELTRLSAKEFKPLRREIQMVFQDPLASLSPRLTIARAVEQPLKALFPELSAPERSHRALAMLERVGIEPSLAGSYPHKLSGGQCQRVGIARALVVNPRLLICDEPVSALDVSVQAQVINLLADLQREMGLSLIFIAHDLAVVARLSQRVLVLFAGKVMEQGPRDALFHRPAHPYTQALLASVPGATQDLEKREGPDGEPPSLSVPLLGCVFRNRCPIADDLCGRATPPLKRVRAGWEQFSACHFSAPQLDATQPVTPYVVAA